jgi:hypothetical protein
MSDGVLAAIIAAGATVFTSFLQLRTSLAKQLGAQTLAASSRRKRRASLLLVLAMLAGASVGGFALAEWLHERERAAQDALQRDLRERIADMNRERAGFEHTRSATHAEIEGEVMRRMGADGVAVLATVAPCAAPRSAGTVAGATDSGGAPTLPPAPAAAASTCTESDAAPITLCATIPAAAKLTDVELYVRSSGPGAPWTLATAGQETEQARFAEKPSEIPDGSAAKQVCEGFVQWSERSRIARMVVHFSL